MSLPRIASIARRASSCMLYIINSSSISIYLVIYNANASRMHSLNIQTNASRSRKALYKNPRNHPTTKPQSITYQTVIIPKITKLASTHQHQYQPVPYPLHPDPSPHGPSQPDPDPSSQHSQYRPYFPRHSLQHHR